MEGLDLPCFCDKESVEEMKFEGFCGNRGVREIESVCFFVTGCVEISDRMEFCGNSVADGMRWLQLCESGGADGV